MVARPFIVIHMFILLDCANDHSLAFQVALVAFLAESSNVVSIDQHFSLAHIPFKARG